MKNFKSIVIKFIAIIAVITGLLSCNSEHDFAPFENSVGEDVAKLKYIHTAIGPLGVNFSTNVFLNDVKTTSVGVTSGLPLGLSYGSIFPIASNYALIKAGTQSMRITIPERLNGALPNIPASDVLTTPLETNRGLNYSSFLVGVSPNYSVMTVRDNLAITNVNDSQTYIRFFNFISNTPAGGYDLAIVRTTPATPTTPQTVATIKTFSSVPYLGGSNVFEGVMPIPVSQNAPDVLQLRLAGTATVVATLSTGFVPRPGRIYTILARGFVGGLSNGSPSATVNIPVVAFHVNL